MRLSSNYDLDQEEYGGLQRSSPDERLLSQESTASISPLSHTPRIDPSPAWRGTTHPTLIRRFFNLWSRPQELKETAWLDGLRGLASFLVMTNHFNYTFLSNLVEAPYGAVMKQDVNADGIWYYRKGEVLTEWWRLPLLKLFVCSGGAQVCVFFALSGFVLSWDPLQKVRRGEYEEFARGLGSAVFRRWMRLYLPCFAVGLLYLAKRLVVGAKDERSMMGEVWHLVVTMEQWSNPFEQDFTSPVVSANEYNLVLWTIPFEFNGSLLIFLLVLVVARISRPSRRACLVAVVSIYACLSSHWSLALFGCGLALADHVVRIGGFDALEEGSSRPRRVGWTLVLLVGLLLMGTPPPSKAYQRTGYEWIGKIPLPVHFRDYAGEATFWWGFGAVLALLSACHLRWLQQFFEIRIMQHLGRISFTLYLIHVLVLETVGTYLRSGMYGTLSKEYSDVFRKDVYVTSPIRHVSIICVLWLLTTPIAIVAAHYLELCVDRPCIMFSRWLDATMLRSKSSTRGKAG